MPPVTFSRLPALLLFVALVAPQTVPALAQEVIVGFREPVGPLQRELIGLLGGEINREYSLIPAVSASVPDTSLATLRSHPLVAYVETDAEVTRIVEEPHPSTSPAPQPIFSMASTDDEYASAWGVRHIDSEFAHILGITGKGVKIAVIDSGIDYNHEDLDGNYAGGYDFVNSDTDPMDDTYNSHGTNVAGIIAAERNGIGVVGVAPDASLYALKVLTSIGTGLTSSTVSAIEWAVENGMDIINISIQGEHRESLQAACDAAQQAGLLIIAAAGNTGGQAVSYPAAYSSVVAVTATDDTDALPSYDPQGSEVEFSAPGDNIYSTARVSKGGYTTLSGTSQAAPHVTGLAALILSSGSLTDLNNDSVIDARDLRLKLQSAVEDLGTPGRDELFGFGLVNTRKAFPPAAEIRIERGEQWFSGWEYYSVENKKARLFIENRSLYGLISFVTENGVFRRDLSRVDIFEGYRRTAPQSIDYELDANGTTLNVIFVPFGKTGSSADITIIN